VQPRSFGSKRAHRLSHRHVDRDSGGPRQSMNCILALLPDLRSGTWSEGITSILQSTAHR
jgi:hypothetical protein